MKRLASLILLFATTALADGLPTSPNSVPLFYGLLGSDPKYHDAAFKAQQAFLIQTGFTPMYDKVNGYATSKVTNGVTYTIDTYTPFSSRDVFFTVGAVYTVCVKKQIVQKFSDPLNHSIKHTISLDRNNASTGVSIPF